MTLDSSVALVVGLEAVCSFQAGLDAVAVEGGASEYRFLVEGLDGFLLFSSLFFF